MDRLLSDTTDQLTTTTAALAEAQTAASHALHKVCVPPANPPSLPSFVTTLSLTPALTTQPSLSLPFLRAHDTKDEYGVLSCSNYLPCQERQVLVVEEPVVIAPQLIWYDTMT